MLVALLTALISLNGAVAALLPVIIVTAVRLDRPPSQLLMPMVFGAHAGSMLALTGTPVNVLVSEAAVDAGLQAFGYFEFSIAGIPLLLGTWRSAFYSGNGFCPTAAAGRSHLISEHARTLIEHYQLNDGLFQLRVRAGSPLCWGSPDGNRPE